MADGQPSPDVPQFTTPDTAITVEDGVAAETKPVSPGSDTMIHQNQYNLTISNLTYKVIKTVKSKSEEKILLNAVNAKARHGEILAVMGPSGAGKSTFLDAIAGKIDFNSLEGQILVNGKEMDSQFRRLSGYVMQDDQLFPLLTVKETLMFSARLRLPQSMSHAEKAQRVESLVEELGLKNCTDTVIGDDEVRGVSGGERRRVSIGVDLIHNPPVLFLDEPTSGLDSTSALNVIQNLHDIAKNKQRTIVLTIHQPSFRILELLDNLLILALGNVVYHGSYDSLAPHFTEYGSPPPEHVNTLEFALDLIEEQQKSDKGLQPLIEFMLSKKKGKLGQVSGLRMADSAMGQHTMPVEFATSFFSEFVVLTDRNFKNVFRTKELFGARIGLFVLTGLVMGSLFFNAEMSPKGVQKRQSYFAFILALVFFTSTEALPIFLKERQIFIRETSRGAYRTSSYVVSNTVVFLPFFFILSLVSGVAAYFLVNLVRQADAFFFFCFVVFLCLVLSNSYVIFLSAFVPNFITGNTIITATTAFFFLFSGFFIPRENIPDYWIWFHYISSFKYPLELLQWNEFTKLPKDSCFARNANNVCTMTPQTVLVNSSAGKVHAWANVLIMLLFTFAYRVLLYVALRVQSKSVRK
eukprot:TRINITY_DN16642_c0_g1_i1.p1 TRINITY_DN16642_c0_g1~~TRINITY_DN16642_c0_g1_i1.p1  ORF type:complete len:645 (+),score=134.10 TRINITY_DN16642_c0_g1_i1:25-1935(+)